MDATKILMSSILLQIDPLSRTASAFNVVRDVLSLVLVVVAVTCVLWVFVRQLNRK